MDFPDYDYQTVYFAYQTPVRTLILGDDDESDNTNDNNHCCVVKAVAGGAYSNPNDITIRVAVDPTLTDRLYFKETGEKVRPLPAAYYTLSADEIHIPKGEPNGGITVHFSDAFFADEYALSNTYVLPLRMTHVEGADSILSGRPSVAEPNRFKISDWATAPKDYVLYCVKYINPWDASYMRRGKDEIVGAAGHESLTALVRRHAQYTEQNDIVNVKSTSYRCVKLPLTFKDENGLNTNCEALITFDERNHCTVSSAQPSKYSITGTGKYVAKGDNSGNRARNVIYLDYNITLPNLTCHTLDTLVMRSREVHLETFTPEYR